MTHDDAYGRCTRNVAEGNCPACGEPLDHCRGHDGIDDPDGFAVLEAHELGDHTGCVHSI